MKTDEDRANVLAAALIQLLNDLEAYENGNPVNIKASKRTAYRAWKENK